MESFISRMFISDCDQNGTQAQRLPQKNDTKRKDDYAWLIAETAVHR